MGYKLNLEINTIDDAYKAELKLSRIRKKIWQSMISKFTKDFDKNYKNKWCIYKFPDTGTQLVFSPSNLIKCELQTLDILGLYSYYGSPLQKYI